VAARPLEWLAFVDQGSIMNIHETHEQIRHTAHGRHAPANKSTAIQLVILAEALGLLGWLTPTLLFL
jgi:hypothetical protein